MTSLLKTNPAPPTSTMSAQNRVTSCFNIYRVDFTPHSSTNTRRQCSSRAGNIGISAGLEKTKLINPEGGNEHRAYRVGGFDARKK